MQLAVTWLRESGARPADLRQRLGYNSDAAFSRVFKRTIGAISSEQYRAALNELAGPDLANLLTDLSAQNKSENVAEYSTL